MPQTHIIIVAAGRGSRFGSDTPKQFRLLGDRPVLMHTVIRIGRALPNARISIVLNPDFIDYWEKTCENYGFVSPQVIAGGETRWESVRNALQTINAAPDDIVMIHDGVRPVVSSEMLTAIAKAMETSCAAIPVIPVTDTLREVEDGDKSHSIDRSKMVAVQTPQAFRAQEILQAYEAEYVPSFTDDASVYEAAGYPSPTLVNGSPLNIKITHPRDLEVAALFLGIK